MDEALESLRNRGMGDDLEIIVQDGDVEPDKGQSDALNKGFAKAHGEWLFWLNADDVLLPGALMAVKKRVSGSRFQVSGGKGIDWIAGNQMYIDAEGRVLKCLRGNGWHDWLYRHAVPHVNGPSSFFRRELLERVGPFDTTLRFCMDWDLWIRFGKAGERFVRMDDYLWAQRQWQGSKTQRAKSPEEEAIQMAEVQRMLERNDFHLTRMGVWGVRILRLLNGNYLAGMWDTVCKRGRLP